MTTPGSSSPPTRERGSSPTCSAGPLIDRVGERAAAVSGLALLALGCILTALASSFALAAIFWSGAGVGSAIVFAAMYSLLLKRVPKSRMARTLSVFYGAFNVGIVAGGFWQA